MAEVLESLLLTTLTDRRGPPVLPAYRAYRGGRTLLTSIHGVIWQYAGKKRVYHRRRKQTLPLIARIEATLKSPARETSLNDTWREHLRNVNDFFQTITRTPGVQTDPTKVPDELLQIFPFEDFDPRDENGEMVVILEPADVQVTDEEPSENREFTASPSTASVLETSSATVQFSETAPSLAGVSDCRPSSNQ